MMGFHGEIHSVWSMVDLTDLTNKQWDIIGKYDMVYNIYIYIYMYIYIYVCIYIYMYM